MNKPIKTRVVCSLIFLLLSSLACQLLPPVPLAPTAVPPSATLTFTATVTPTIVTPSATPIPPTETATPTPLPTNTPTSIPATPTIAPTSSPAQVKIFKELWRTVRDNYLYPDFNGVSWDAIYSEYYGLVLMGLSQDVFYAKMDEMIDRLNDNHSAFLNPIEVSREQNIYEGNVEYAGVGVLVKVVPERKRVTVILVFPGSPADYNGIKPHDSILAVDGIPILNELGEPQSLLAGIETSIVNVTVETPGQPPRTLPIIRQFVQASMPVPHEVLITPGGKRIGYLMIASLAEDGIDDLVGEALMEMSAEEPLDGVILDNRMNPGGVHTVLKGVLSYFTSGNLGYFRDRENKKYWLTVTRKDVGGSSRLPMVVLVGKDTVSFGEILSGVLKDKGRAYLIGETTEGNVELLRPFTLHDDSVLLLAYADFHPANAVDANWEKTGIIPDLTVPTNWDEITLSSDLAIEVAFVYFDTH